MKDIHEHSAVPRSVDWNGLTGRFLGYCGCLMHCHFTEEVNHADHRQ